jgi:hypothetical protein
MDRVSLAVFMWVNLKEAVGDMPAGPVSELFARFIHWTRRPGPATTPVRDGRKPGSAGLSQP